MNIRQFFWEWLIPICVGIPIAGLYILGKRSEGWRRWGAWSLGLMILLLVCGLAFLYYQEPLETDEQRLAKFRQRFRKGPIGYWCTSLGGGAEITHGCDFLFRPDGTGIFWYWGGPEENPRGETPFAWRLVGVGQIEARKHGQEDWEKIPFDFFLRRNEYQIIEMCLFQPGHWGIQDQEAGFWWSPNPLVYLEEETGRV